jgi:hypothetical protein
MVRLAVEPLDRQATHIHAGTIYLHETLATPSKMDLGTRVPAITSITENGTRPPCHDA